MRLRTTSIQRTYRYVRLAIVGATVFLAISVGLEIGGGGDLASVSASYYTPAGPVFVGALSAIALALLALSGRSLEQGLLDIAAVLLLVVAFVPTTLDCVAVSASCVPPEVRPTVVNNAVAVASIVVLGTVAAAILARTQGTATRGVAWTIAVIATLVVGGASWAVTAPESFLTAAHTVAAVAFFSLIAVVAAIAAWRPHRRGVGVVYAVVAAAMVLTLVLLAVGMVVGLESAGFPVVLVGESVALVLFAVFWIVQTVELWNEPDPTLRTNRE